MDIFRFQREFTYIILFYLRKNREKGIVINLILEMRKMRLRDVTYLVKCVSGQQGIEWIQFIQCKTFWESTISQILEISDGYRQDWKGSIYPFPCVIASYLLGLGRASSPMPWHQWWVLGHSGTMPNTPLLIHCSQYFWKPHIGI